MEEMEGAAADASGGGGGGGGGGVSASFFAAGPGAGGGGGEYSKEKLAALRKGQNFQVSTKPAKSAGEKGKGKGGRVTFLDPGACVRACVLLIKAGSRRPVWSSCVCRVSTS
jgi:hypothetical protein